MAEKSERTKKTEGNRLCQYEYKSKEFKGDQCPHPPLPHEEVCYWHEFRNRKDVIKEKGRELKALDLREAYLAHSNLQEAHLEKANLREADLWGAELQEGKLSGVILQGASLGKAKLQKAELYVAKLQRANLFDANLQEAKLGKANLQKTHLAFANLEKAILVGAILQEADLKNVNLQKAHLEKAILEKADLERADLREAKLCNANLQRANLEGADLQNCDLAGSYLTDANLFHCKLRNSNLKNVKLLYDEISKKIIQEKAGDYWRSRGKYQKSIKEYEKAEEVYRDLKIELKDEGLYQLSGKLYYKEMTVRRKLHWERKVFSHWFGNWLMWISCGYGERLYQVLLWWFITIFLFTGLYWAFDCIEKDTGTISLHEYLYFSVVTFTTLGFGDIHPKGNIMTAQYLAMSEALIGAMLMGLFLFTLAKQIMR